MFREMIWTVWKRMQGAAVVLIIAIHQELLLMDEPCREVK